MPMQTCILKRKGTASGFKAAKGWVPLLCTNAKGDCTMKPMMLYQTLNPCALNSKNKHTLPMFWKANRKVWVTAAIFMDWFHNCFIHQVERYLAEIYLSFKVLLLINNAPGPPGT